MTTALSPLRGFVCDVTADPGTAVPGFIRLPLRGKFLSDTDVLHRGPVSFG